MCDVKATCCTVHNEPDQGQGGGCGATMGGRGSLLCATCACAHMSTKRTPDGSLLFLLLHKAAVVSHTSDMEAGSRWATLLLFEISACGSRRLPVYATYVPAALPHRVQVGFYCGETGVFTLSATVGQGKHTERAVRWSCTKPAPELFLTSAQFKDQRAHNTKRGETGEMRR